MAATNVGLDSLEFLCSADAQQVSACAWLIALAELELFDSPLCIGQSLSAQHAIRASGVGAQPAQTAALPAEINTASASANNRLLRISTSLECRTRLEVSNRVQVWQLFRSESSLQYATRAARRASAFGLSWVTGSNS